MSKPRAPLWLVCDPAASMRLWLALCLLWSIHRIFLPKDPRRSPSVQGIAWLTVGLSLCESLLRWAIARQARRACGLDPKARFFHLSSPETCAAWRIRGLTFFAMLEDIDGHARRMARRMKQALAAKSQAIPATTPIPHPAAQCVSVRVSVCAFMPSWTRGIPAPP